MWVEMAEARFSPSVAASPLDKGTPCILLARSLSPCLAVAGGVLHIPGVWAIVVHNSPSLEAMAATTMTMAVASTRYVPVASRVEMLLAKNTPHLSMAAPSVTPASISLTSSGVCGFSLGRRSSKNVSLAARAVELEQDTFGSESFDTPDSSPPPESTPGTKLYVGNLPWSCDSQQLAEIFQDSGNVELVEVIYDRETSRSRGFAFVTMASVEDAQAAIEKLDGQELEGRSLKVNFPQSNKEPREPRNNFRSERPPRREGGDFGGGRNSSYNSPNKLFVGNLAWGVDDVSLEQLFSDYGKVVDAKVVYDRESGRSRGFGFVTYTNASEVNEAIQNLDGAEFDGRQLRVNLAGDKPPPRSF